ncbi:MULTISPECIES: 3-hydroxyacyl-ACP dehydratase FabZ [Gammaproteobacteria]|uniref:3-hydroxyacyl-ACP dehydratase FabZ n=1 Tax=Gammaproteobacteria TaxID=1236 RepID=UPI000DCFA2D3|nr:MULTISPECIES: 3-hydroxyacyl-ACP dehydratase FabZ [Gammaproteobacteria]RTE87004.1 3-hydroxyacyl-ACP dehydratase FabZ [Aliidiomarina sp. B3213]TCZ93206.1 3-hydroxyacyl-ACP dehydratase FabZ [Lysobacter sp. N42]
MSKEQLPGFDINEISEILPHRYPFALVDRVISYVPGESLHAIKNITMNEPVFTGHFPGNPIFPGVLLLEAMAQATGLLGFKMVEDIESNEIYLFAGIDNARFKRQVIPGDRVDLFVEFDKEKRGIWKFKGRAEVDGQLAASADLMCARRKV